MFGRPRVEQRVQLGLGADRLGAVGDEAAGVRGASRRFAPYTPASDEERE